MKILSGLRHFRIFGFTLFDTTLALIAIYFLAPFLSKAFKKIGILIPRRSWLLWTLPIGVFIHKLIGQSTPMTKEFFDLKGHYIIKIVIFLLIILGFVGVKKNKK
jgi:hypothetical protein